MGKKKFKFNPKYRWLVICLCMLAALIALFILFGVRLFSQTELEPARRLEAPDYPVVAGSITLEQKPENIIVLDSTATQTLIQLKLEDCIIGVGDDTDTTPGMKAQNHLGSSHNPDYNAILSFSDALLITAESIPAGEMAQLTARNIQVLVLPADTQEDGYYSTLVKLWGNYPDELEETTSSTDSDLSQTQPAA